MPEATRVPCNSEHRTVHTALLPLLGYLVVDLVLWGKPAKHLVFPAREYGRQYVNSVLRILPAGGLTLCYHLSLRVDRTDKYYGGFTSMVRSPYVVKAKGFCKCN